MKRIYFILLTFCLQHLHAQRLTDMVNYPATPQASAIFKAIAAPVSYYTGQPDISFPIYTISQDGVEVPVSISFNTSGILVNEESTSLGLGVRLDWGGSVSRSVNGSPDEWGFFTNTYNIGTLKQEIPKDYSNNYNLACFPYCSDLAQLNILKERIETYNQANTYSDPFGTPSTVADNDFRPDDFHYSFLGKSGLFKFNQNDRKFITFPLDDIIIEKTTSTASIDKFDITTSDGTKVTFGDGARESVSKSNTNKGYVQTWHIKQIKTIKNSTIDFSYIPNQYWSITQNDTQVLTPVAIRSMFGQGGIQGGESTASLNYENLIGTITFESGKLDFIYINDRIDINATDPSSSLPNAGQPAPRLSKIVLYDKNNQPVKTFKFYQSYFTATSSLTAVDNNRMRLDSLDIQNTALSTVERYVFQYYTNSTLPTKKSKARDHWGYYNGANTNTISIPSSVGPLDLAGLFFGTSWSGYDNWHDYYASTIKGNRFVNSLYNKTFTIKKIIYPTGGEREYVFEDNYVRWYEYLDKMKDISNDGYDFVNQRMTVQGSTLGTSYPAAASSTSTERNVFGEEFTVDDFNDTTMGEPNVFIRTNYVNPAITPSQLNMWEYRIEIGIQQKINGVFTNYSLLTNINRTDQNITYNPTIMQKLAYLPNGQYRIYVKMITPPQYVMDQWLNSSGQVINYSHFTVVGLTYRKKNLSDIRVGGLRIQEIIDRDGINEYKTDYEYTSGGYCSGQMINSPEYVDNILLHGLNPWDNNGELETTDVSGKRINSESIFPLLKTQGSNVGYTNVIKTNASDGKVIKEEFTYNFTPSLQTGYMRQYYQETEPRTWQSGKLISHKQYSNGTLIQEDVFDYYGLTNETDKGFVEEINTSLVLSAPYQYAGIDNMQLLSIIRRPENPPLIFQGLPYRRPDLYYFDNRADAAYDAFWSPQVGYITPILKIPYFKSYTGFDKIKKKTTTNYFNSGNTAVVENYYYAGVSNNNLAMTSKEISTSLDDTVTTKFYYPQDLLSDPLMNNMVIANRVGTPVRTETLRGSTKLTEEKFVYAQDATTSNLLLPKYIYAAKFPNDLPNLQNIGALEKKMTYEFFDTKGNLVQYKPEGGVSTTIIWSYNSTLPVAKIENATYNTVISVLGGATSLTNFSNSNPTDASANSFLNVLRTSSLLSNAMVTTYTYKQLVGVTSVTDPKGDTTTYEYDNFGRLKSVKDKFGKTLSENFYNYKP